MNFTLDVLKLKMKRKIKVLGAFNGSFFSHLVGGGHNFMGPIEKQILTSCIKHYEIFFFGRTKFFILISKDVVLLKDK